MAENQKSLLDINAPDDGDNGGFDVSKVATLVNLASNLFNRNQESPPDQTSSGMTGVGSEMAKNRTVTEGIPSGVKSGSASLLRGLLDGVPVLARATGMGGFMQTGGGEYLPAPKNFDPLKGFRDYLGEVESSNNYTGKYYQGENLPSLFSKFNETGSPEDLNRFVDYTVNRVAQQIPIQAALWGSAAVGVPAPLALAVMGTSATGQRYTQDQEDAPQLSEDDRMSRAMQSGVMEAGTEGLSFGMKRAAMAGKSALQAIPGMRSIMARALAKESSSVLAKASKALGSTAASRIMSNTLQNMLGEGFEEVVNEAGQIMSDEAYGVRMYTVQQKLDAMIEAFGISAIASGLVGSPMIAAAELQGRRETGDLPSLEELYTASHIIKVFKNGLPGSQNPANQIHTVDGDVIVLESLVDDMIQKQEWKEEPDSGILQAIGEHLKKAIFDERGFVRISKEGFSSYLEEIVKTKLPNKATPEQILRTLEGAGVPLEEVQDMGLFQFLEGRPTVTKQELVDYLEGNDVQVQEVEKKSSGPVFHQGFKTEAELDAAVAGDEMLVDSNGDLRSGLEVYQGQDGLFNLSDSKEGRDTKFHSYALPGGENYREVLLTLPVNLMSQEETAKKMYGKSFAELSRTEQMNVGLEYNQGRKEEFSSSHFDEPNVLAHVRLNDRTDSSGKKILFVEELQSDWHQKGRKHGYVPANRSQLDARRAELEKLGMEAKEQGREFPSELKQEWADIMNELRPNDEGKRPPDAPFKKSWHELALKRVLRMAAEGGYDTVAWTTGEQQAERYDLSKQVEKITVGPSEMSNQPKGYFVEAYKNGEPVIAQFADEKTLGDLIGKELAKRAIEQGAAKTKVNFEGLDLKVGGEGMKGFYDQIIPAFLNKYTKKWGGRVGTREIAVVQEEDVMNGTEREEGSFRAHALEITPAMRKAIMKGQPVYGSHKGGGEAGFARVNKDPEWQAKKDEADLAAKKIAVKSMVQYRLRHPTIVKNHGIAELVYDKASIKEFPGLSKLSHREKFTLAQELRDIPDSVDKAVGASSNPEGEIETYALALISRVFSPAAELKGTALEEGKGYSNLSPEEQKRFNRTETITALQEISRRIQEIILFESDALRAKAKTGMLKHPRTGKTPVNDKQWRDLAINGLERGNAASGQHDNYIALNEQKNSLLEQLIDMEMGAAQIISNSREKASKKQIKDMSEEEKAWFDLSANQMEVFDEVPPAAYKEIDDVLGAIDPHQLKDVKGILGNGLAMGWKDPYRIFEHVFGKHFPKIEKTIMRPLDESVNEFIEFQKRATAELKRDIVDGLGIKKAPSKLTKLLTFQGLSMSSAVQLYGEQLMTEDQLLEYFGEEKTKRIKAAERWFRAKYDALLVKVNNVRAKIYPNNPQKLIPHRDNYFRHFFEMTELSSLKNLFDTPANIPSELAGTSQYTQPKAKLLGFSLPRMSLKTDIDAVGGYLNYIPAAAQAMYVDPMIPKLRALEKKMRVLTHDTKNLNNFIEFLMQYTNDLSGKTNLWDRGLQQFIGRKGFRILNYINGRAKKNTVLYSLSSMMAQIFNIPLAVAKTKLYFPLGAADYMKSNLLKNGPHTKSLFLNTRYGSDVYDAFSVDLMSKPTALGKWMLQVFDEVGTKMSWYAFYDMAVGQKMQDPVRYADINTRKVVGGRGLHEVPLAQKSKFFQLIVPFTLEVQNLWWVMGDLRKDKIDFVGYVLFAVAAWLMNNGSEVLLGNRVVFDPLNALLDAIRGDKTIPQRIGRVLGEVAANLPGGNYVQGIYPEYGGKFLGYKMPTRTQFFGGNDRTRYQTGILAHAAILDPLLLIAPPGGGRQVKKTMAGRDALDKGYVQSGREKIKFDPTVKTGLRALAFGKGAIPEVREHYKKKEDRKAYPYGKPKKSSYGSYGKYGSYGGSYGKF